jgi:hypothetical protein
MFQPFFTARGVFRDAFRFFWSFPFSSALIDGKLRAALSALGRRVQRRAAAQSANSFGNDFAAHAVSDAAAFRYFAEWRRR